jgi:hypothetical protein
MDNERRAERNAGTAEMARPPTLLEHWLNSPISALRYHLCLSVCVSGRMPFLNDSPAAVRAL